MKRASGIAAALVLAAIVALWLRPDGESAGTAAPVVAALTLPVENAAPVGVERRVPSRAVPAAAAPASPADASEPPDASLEQAMAERAYDGFGSRLVDYLARQGLARIDAEPIVVELLGKTVTCALDAMRAQALEQRVDFDLVRSALEAELYDADGPLLTAIVDVGAVDRRAMPCATTAFAQAGLPPQAAADLFNRQNR